MTDSYKIIYSPAAWNDLTAIYRYIAVELSEMNTAQNQIDRIRNGIKKLDLFPKKHPLVEWEPWHSSYTHRVPIDNFIVFYIVNDKDMTVTIVRIVYGGQDINNIRF